MSNSPVGFLSNIPTALTAASKALLRALRTLIGDVGRIFTRLVRAVWTGYTSVESRVAALICDGILTLYALRFFVVIVGIGVLLWFWQWWAATIYAVLISVAVGFYYRPDHQDSKEAMDVHAKYRSWLSPVICWAMRAAVALIAFLYLHSLGPSGFFNQAVLQRIYSMRDLAPSRTRKEPNADALLGTWAGRFNCGVKKHTIEMTFYRAPTGINADIFVAGIGGALYTVAWSPPAHIHASPERETEHIVTTTWLSIDGDFSDERNILGTVQQCGALSVQKQTDQALRHRAAGQLLNGPEKAAETQKPSDRTALPSVAPEAEKAPEALNAQAPAPPMRGAYRIGGGVSAPAVILKVEPNYSAEAHSARLQGTVILSLVVGEDGLARDIKVTKSLGLGLDENAIEAVKQWRFSPGKKDGSPVPVVSTIECNFRLN